MERGLEMSDPEIVCVCGSGRFIPEILDAVSELTATGAIVVSSTPLNGDKVRTEDIPETRALLDSEVDMSDRVVVVAINGYIDATIAEAIQRARSQGKPVEVWDRARDRGRSVCVNVPRIPFAPPGNPDSVDADYYREGARNIRFNAGLGKSSIGGSNLTETVAALCESVADALSN